MPDLVERGAPSPRRKPDVTSNRERFLEALLASATDYAIIGMDLDGLVTQWNEGAVNVLGWTEAEMLGWPASVFFTPEDRQAGVPQAEMKAALETGRGSDERWHLRKDETRFWANGEMMPLKDEAGVVQGFIKILRDRTAQRLAAEAQRADAEFLRSVLASSGDCIKVLDMEGRLTFMSEGGKRVMEVNDFSAIAGCPWPDFWTGQENAEAIAAIEAAKAGGVGQFQGFAKTMRGVTKWWDVQVTPILDGAGRPEKLLAVSRDLSDRRRAEEALEDERRTLEALNRIGTAVAAELDLERVVQMVTDAGVEVIGAASGAFFYNVLTESGERYQLYTLSAGVPKNAFDRFPMPRNTAVFGPTFRGESVVRSDDILADPRYGKNAPYQGMPPGHLAVRSYLAVPVISRSGEVTGALLFGHPEPGRFQERHERLITGIAAQTAIAIDNARLYQAAQKANEQLAQRVRELHESEATIRELNETLERRVEERTHERDRIEEALRQSQKMDALGQLTGGIAHDFNNLLTGIIGSLDLVRRRMADGRSGEVPRFMDAASTSAQRAAALTHRLLAFARRQSLDTKPSDVNALVQGMEELLHRTLGEQVSLSTELSEGLWPALADDNQLENAILNLAINARDAMPEGGRLTIETANTRLDAAYAATAEDVSPGDYVMIAVSDTGSGMPPDVLAKAFDPFFTTKPIGEGTGLGLSMIYGFIKQSAGHVRIYSEVGHGTTIKMFLRRAEEARETAADEAGEVPLGQGETVLVVEDDEAVRLIITSVLEELGYRHLEAPDGYRALPILQSDVRIDLLVTDVGLPKMNGRQLAEMARAARPGLRVLFVTGYAEKAAVRHGFLEPGMEMLMKPFALDALATKIRGMLER
jgi:PAS domain S-box-containing protein